MILGGDWQEPKKWLIVCELRRGEIVTLRRRTAYTFATRHEAVAETERLNREEFGRLDALGYIDADGALIAPQVTSDRYVVVHQTDLHEIDWHPDEF